MRLVRIAAALGAVLLGAAPAAAQNNAAQAFVGKFQGVAVVKAAGPNNTVVETRRALSFEMTPTEKGFKMGWLSLEGAPGAEKVDDGRRRQELAEFKPVGKGVYHAEIVNEKTGERGVYLARFVGPNLVVQVVGMDEEGRLVTQLYRRSIQGNQMTLNYQLIVNTVLTRTIQGRLQKAAAQ